MTDLRDKMLAAIDTEWHEGGMYARADLDPRWLQAVASVVATICADVAQAEMDERLSAAEGVPNA